MGWVAVLRGYQSRVWGEGVVSGRSGRPDRISVSVVVSGDSEVRMPSGVWFMGSIFVKNRSSLNSITSLTAPCATSST